MTALILAEFVLLCLDKYVIQVHNDKTISHAPPTANQKGSYMQETGEETGMALLTDTVAPDGRASCSRSIILELGVAAFVGG